MKKFEFTLQALANYKDTVEKQQKAELRNAQEALRELQDKERELLEVYAATERSLERVLREEPSAQALSEHDAYFRFLRDALKEVRALIVKAEGVVYDCQQRLILTMREIKMYGKLRAEQYRDYLKDVAAEEEKEISDLVSFNTVSEEKR